MTKVTVHNNETAQGMTPTEQVMQRAKSQLPDHVVDELGRTINLKMPSALEQFDLMAAFGKESPNDACGGMAGTLLYVAAINGEPFATPASYAQIRAGISILRMEGIVAITKALKDHLQAQTELEEVEYLKK